MSNGDRSSIKAIVAIVLILVAAGFLYWYFGSSPNPHIARDTEVLGIDSVTSKVYIVQKKADESWPLTNPDTNQKTLWVAYFCPDEKIIFAVPPKTDTRGPCPFCGSSKKGIATKKHKDYPVRKYE